MRTKLTALGALVIVAGVSSPAAAAQRPASIRPLAHRATVTRTVAGVVVGRDAARHTLMVAAPNGLVRTLRVGAHTAAIGDRVLTRDNALADGTFLMRRLAVTGRVRRARLHGTVVGSSGAKLLLSAGGSELSVRRGGLSAHVTGTSSAGGLGAGQVVSATVAINPTGVLDATSLQQVGQTGLVGLDGVISSLGAGSLQLAVEQGALTTITIPPSLSLPTTIAVGDRVEVLVSYSNAAFTLVTINDDHAAASGTTQGVSESGTGSNEAVVVEGTVVSVDTATLVVQPGDGAAQATLAVPSGFDLTGVVVGADVKADGTLVNGTLTLTNVEVRSAEQGDQTTHATGTVASVDTSTLVVQPTDGSAQVTFAVPSGFDLTGVVVGADVKADGTLVNGTLTLTNVEVPSASSTSSGGSPTGTSDS
ncbi:MAG TPA: hypothetical protein VMU75_04740 [Acidimicrobiales bacterium]|nr:hypothetical protein [Acidimicrobiales bacterium]